MAVLKRRGRFSRLCSLPGLLLRFPVACLRYCISLGYVVLQLFQLGMIFYTLALLAQPGVETSGPNCFKGPLATEQASLQVLEPISLFGRLTCLCLHPLRLPRLENPKVAQADPVTDFKTEEA